MTQRNKAHDRIVYDDFSLGEYGTTHPRLAKRGSFSGSNVVVYRDGTLGPRNGLVEQPLSGANYVNGALNAFFFGVENETATPRMIFSQGTRPKNFEVNTTTPQNPQLFTPTDIDAAPDNDMLAVLPRLGFNTFLGSLGDGVYLLNNLDDTLTKLTGTNASFGAHDIIEYLDQVYLIGIGDAASGRGHKITYSDHADPETWPNENIFLVGYAWVVFRGLALLNGLLIIAQDHSWWLLQGTPEEGSLRRVWHGDGPEIGNPRAVLVDRESAIFLTTGAPGGAYPMTFDGSEVDSRSLAHLRGWMSNANAGGLVCERDHDVLFIDNNSNALMRHEGVWTRHHYEIGVGEWCAAYEDQRFYLAIDGVDGVAKPRFFRSTFATTGPAQHTTADFTSPTDDGENVIDAYVEFPEMWPEDGSTVRPMSVMLEFTSYDTNAPEGENNDNHIACEVDVIDRFKTDEVQTVDGGEWREADETDPSTSEGVRRRKLFPLPLAHFGAGVQLRFTGIRGVKIERAILDFERAEQLDRA